MFKFLCKKKEVKQPEPEIIKEKGNTKMKCPECSDEIVNIPAAYAFVGQYGKCSKCYQAEVGRMLADSAMRYAQRDEALKKAQTEAYRVPEMKGKGYDIPPGTKPGEAFSGGATGEQLADNRITPQTSLFFDEIYERQKQELRKAGWKV